MKRKAIQIDWDELEAAFENRSEDLSYYLDTVTGQVGLEGQGEDAHFDDDELDGAVEAAPGRGARGAPPRGRGRRGGGGGPRGEGPGELHAPGHRVLLRPGRAGLDGRV